MTAIASRSFPSLTISSSFEIRQEVLPPFYGAPPLTGEGEVEHNLTIFRAGVNYRF